jgi:micrococcal nuclease
MEVPYIYRGKVIKIVDGDTVVIQIDLGFNMTMIDSFRLYGINAPEMSTQAGKDTKLYLGYILPLNSEIVVQTHKDKREKYGRWLAKIFFNDLDINFELIRTGHAVTFLDNIKKF